MVTHRLSLKLTVSQTSQSPEPPELHFSGTLKKCVVGGGGGGAASESVRELRLTNVQDAKSYCIAHHASTRPAEQ